jgi:hypothetical protein
LLWYVFPLDTHISWEGPLSGFGVGVLLAFLYKGTTTVTNKKYDWEAEDYSPQNDPFMQQFDADGNFIENKPKVDEQQLNTTSKKDIGVMYTIVKQKKE